MVFRCGPFLWNEREENVVKGGGELVGWGGGVTECGVNDCSCCEEMCGWKMLFNRIM